MLLATFRAKPVKGFVDETLNSSKRLINFLKVNTALC